MWACCTFSPNGARECQYPSTNSFPGPAPSDLITYWKAGASTSIATAAIYSPKSSSANSLTSVVDATAAIYSPKPSSANSLTSVVDATTSQTQSTEPESSSINSLTTATDATTSQTRSTEPKSSSITICSVTTASNTANPEIGPMPPSKDTGGSSISIGAIAGIAVSSTFAGIALILVIFIAMYKRLVNRRVEEDNTLNFFQNRRNMRTQQQHHELPANEVHNPQCRRDAAQ